MPIITTPLSEDTKYSVADAITVHCSNLSPEVVSKNSKFYFREVINSQIIVNGRKDTVVNMFLEEDALHITNLVLQRLQAPRLVKTVTNVQVEVPAKTAKK